MTAPAAEEADVVVVGGGPAGSTIGALVAMQGHRVVLLEKETFPRYQIGESLLPATIHGICVLTGAADEIAQAGFTLKRGGTFRWGATPAPWTFGFAISPRFPGPTSFAYQVERMKFDEILLNNARRVGVDVRERSPVIDVLADEERVRGVRYTDADAKPHDVAARFVVDASGNTSRIYKRVGGERIYSDFFRSIALFGYFEGGGRLPEPNAGNILCVAFDHGWFWYIPLTPQLTSVGAVVRRDMAHLVQGDPETALLSLISQCSLIAELLSGAKRVTEGPYGEIRARKDYSYCHTRFWRPGMVLIGDAACFIDPVFSSGVHLATYSALLAARSINSCLAELLDEERAFEEFEKRYRLEYGNFYEFLLAFYDVHVDEQSYFWTAKKVTNCTADETTAFVELVGGIASNEAVLSGQAVKEQFARSSRELAATVERLFDPASESENPVFAAPIVDRVMHAGAEIQAQAMLGADAEREGPAFPNGLVASEDGAHWVPASP